MHSKLRLMLTVKSSLLTLCWNCKYINKRNGCSFHIREPISRLMNKISVEAITKLFYVVSRLSMRSFCPIYNYDLYIVKLDGNRVNIMPSSSNWYLIINGFVLATQQQRGRADQGSRGGRADQGSRGAADQGSRGGERTSTYIRSAAAQADKVSRT